jgi:large subunit ribosomal protein L17
MVTSLIHHERIRTTVPKAKELRRVAEWMVTLAKDGKTYCTVSSLILTNVYMFAGSLAARRRAGSVVSDKLALHKLFAIHGPRYENRNGGYTRVLKCGMRHGDAADMAFIEYVDREGELRPARPGTAKKVDSVDNSRE